MNDQDLRDATVGDDIGRLESMVMMKTIHLLK
jgi:hypothetical protein